MRRRILTPLLLTLLLTTMGCPAANPALNGIECTLDEGAFWHDIHLSNKSGKDLHEVKVKLTLIGETGEPRSEERYYVLWPDGQTMKVSLSVENSPVNVQKILLAGECTEGKIDKSWVSPQARPAGSNANATRAR